MKKKTIIAFVMMMWLPTAALFAQKLTISFRDVSLAEALRQIDQAQKEKNIFFLFDDLDMFTVTTDIVRLPATKAVRKVCDKYPVSIIEEGDNIFVEYVPKIVPLHPVVVNGRTPSYPALLTADSLSDDLADIQRFARHIVYFNRVCPQEKVYLHLDNTAYFQGETIWYSANVVNASTGGMAASKVLYVELLSPTGVVLKQQKLKIVDGRCHGSFPLVDADVQAAVDLRGAIGYPSGYYEIRAYTRAQLNFDEAGIFSRIIPVYREPELEGLYDDPIITDYEGEERNRPSLPRAERPKELNVIFYPEGGHLIEGVACRIAFKVTDENGMGTDVDAVVTADNRTIPTVPMHKGMSAFEHTPQKGAESVSLIKNGKKYTFTLPKTEPKGCSVRINALDDQVITAAIEGLNMGKEKILGYTITTGGRVIVCDTLQLVTDGKEPRRASALLHVDKRDMPTGVYQFTLFDTRGSVFAQRMFFIDNGIPTVPVIVSYGTKELQPFDSISLHLHTDAPLGLSNGQTFSLSVRDAADYGTAYRDDVRTYMLLSSELKGLIEEPGWYFITPPSGEAKGRLSALDILMMIQGWTRYDWRRMAGVESFAARHYTEEQLVLDGWAFSRILERPLANTKIYAKLYSPDRKQMQHSVVTTDSLGYWSIGLEDFEGDWSLFLASRQPIILRDKVTTRIRLERSARPDVKPFRPEDIFLPRYTNPYPTLFSWQKEIMPKVELLKEPNYKDKSPRIDTTYVIDDVVIEGKRRYIDYERFRAFDADKDTQLDLDEGNYTKDIAGYLESKGYSLMFYYNNISESLPGDGRFIHHINTDHSGGLSPNGGSSVQYIGVSRVDVEGHRTKWTILFPDSALRSESAYNEYKFYRKEAKWGPSMNDNARPWRVNEGAQGSSWNIDMEDVQSVLVFGYEPGHRFVEVVINMKSIDEIKPKEKNYRETTFTGYTPVVEFYAPKYPKGPVEGDKDYRRTIYWNPAVTTDANGDATVTFYNNGYSRALTVSAEGLTKEGIPIVNTK